MRIKERVVSALLRIYPSPWRNEYGAELSHRLVAMVVVAIGLVKNVVAPRAFASGVAQSVLQPSSINSADHSMPSPWSVFVSPIFQLPWSFVWGTVGGYLGRHLDRQMRVA